MRHFFRGVFLLYVAPMAILALTLTSSACGGGDRRSNPTAPSAPSTPPAPSTGRLAISMTATAGWSSIEVTVNGKVVGTLTRYLEPDGTHECEPLAGARVVTTVEAGNVAWSATSDTGKTWSNTQQVSAGGCWETQLTCTNRNCSPAPSPQPPPPSSAPGFYVRGGPDQQQYLGFFTCVFCVEYATESINNQYGNYGSQYSQTSIRNPYSQYGSPYSTYSACNQYATNPPRVYNSTGSVYYGELTVNQYRADRIRTANIVNWLATDVCSH